MAHHRRHKRRPLAELEPERGSPWPRRDFKDYVCSLVIFHLFVMFQKIDSNSFSIDLNPFL